MSGQSVKSFFEKKEYEEAAKLLSEDIVVLVKNSKNLDEAVEALVRKYRYMTKVGAREMARIIRASQKGSQPPAVQTSPEVALAEQEERRRSPLREAYELDKDLDKFVSLLWEDTKMFLRTLDAATATAALLERFRYLDPYFAAQVAKKVVVQPAPAAVEPQPAPKLEEQLAAPAEPAQPAAPVAVAPAKAETPAPEAQIVVAAPVPPAPAPAPAAQTVTPTPEPTALATTPATCGYCGLKVQLPAGSKGQKCSRCGRWVSLPRVSTMADFCPKCGERVKAQANGVPIRFCAECGASLVSGKLAEPMVAKREEAKKPSILRYWWVALLALVVWIVAVNVTKPAATPTTTTTTPTTATTPTRTPTKTATVEQTKTSAPSRATEPAERIRDLVVLRILMFVLGGLALVLSALLFFVWKRKVWGSLALGLSVVLLFIGGSAWLAIVFSGPATTPTGTPTPMATLSKEEARKTIAAATAEAFTSTPTSTKDPDVAAAEAIGATKAALTGTPSPTPTTTLKPAETTKPTAAPTATPTSKPPEPTKPAPPPVQGNARPVKITGELKALHKNGDEGEPILWNQIALEFFGANGRIGDPFNLVGIGTFEFTTILPKGTIQVGIWIGDDLGGTGWWNTWDVQKVPVGDGSIILTITKKFNRGEP